MGNSTRFLTLPAMEHIDSYLVKAERFIDFGSTEKGVANIVTAGNSIDVIAVPKGCVPIACGAVAITHEDTVTYQMDLVSTTGGTVALLGAVAHTADGQSKNAFPTAGGAVTADAAGGTIRVTIAAADATAGKINFWVLFAKLAQLS